MKLFVNSNENIQTNIKMAREAEPSDENVS